MGWVWATFSGNWTGLGRHWSGMGRSWARGDVTGHDWANCYAGAFFYRRVCQVVIQDNFRNRSRNRIQFHSSSKKLQPVRVPHLFFGNQSFFVEFQLYSRLLLPMLYRACTRTIQTARSNICRTTRISRAAQATGVARAARATRVARATRFAKDALSRVTATCATASKIARVCYDVLGVAESCKNRKSLIVFF